MRVATILLNAPSRKRSTLLSGRGIGVDEDDEGTVAWAEEATLSTVAEATSDRNLHRCTCILNASKHANWSAGEETNASAGPTPEYKLPTPSSFNMRRRAAKKERSANDDEDEGTDAGDEGEWGEDA